VSNQVNTNLDNTTSIDKNNPLHTIDGVKIEFPESKEWVHLRKSNTEPIIRIYAESSSKNNADNLVEKIIKEINAF
jgi:phosphomannomutase